MGQGKIAGIQRSSLDAQTCAVEGVTGKVRTWESGLGRRLTRERSW